jgi:hypothetical protein
MSNFSALDDAAGAYQRRFGSVPTVAGLQGASVARAAELLAAAVRHDLPFKTAAEWYAALGIDPPPDVG